MLSKKIDVAGLLLIAGLIGAGMGTTLHAVMPRFEFHKVAEVGNQMGQTSLVDIDKDGDLDWVVGERARTWWFEYVSPDQWIQHDLGQGAVTDGTVDVANAAILTVVLDNVNVFAGVGASFDGSVIDTSNAVGFSAGPLDLTLVLVKDLTTPANSYTGLELSLSNASLVGITG